MKANCIPSEHELAFFPLFSSYSAALICLAEVRVSHRHCGGGRGPSLTYLGRFNDFLSRRYWCFAVLEVRVKPILLLHFCCLILFFAYEKGSRWSIFEACWNSIPPLHLSLLSGSAMGNFFLKKKKKKTTRILFIPSEKKKKKLDWFGGNDPLFGNALSFKKFRVYGERNLSLLFSGSSLLTCSLVRQL